MKGFVVCNVPIVMQRLNCVVQNREKNFCFEKKKILADVVNCVKLKNNITDFILFNQLIIMFVSKKSYYDKNKNLVHRKSYYWLMNQVFLIKI